MPRDLFSSEQPKEEALVASPESQTPRASDDSDGTSNATGEDGYNEFTIHRDETRQANILHLRNGRAKEKQINDLHPYVQTLSRSNVEDCLALENAVFPENERCSRDKVGMDTLLIETLYLQAPALHSLLFCNSFSELLRHVEFFHEFELMCQT